jgi:hypothetical protein
MMLLFLRPNRPASSAHARRLDELEELVIRRFLLFEYVFYIVCMGLFEWKGSAL